MRPISRASDGRDGRAGEQHLHGLLGGGDGAGQGDAGSGAEEANLHAGGGEGGGLGGHGQVAGGDELASGGGGQALHLGDDRLGQQADGLHDLGAEGEDGGVGFGVAVDYLVQVVAGAEHRAFGAQHHHPDGGVALELAEQLLQLAQQLRGQSVAASGVVEGEEGDTFLQFVANELSNHGGLLGGW